MLAHRSAKVRQVPQGFLPEKLQLQLRKLNCLHGLTLRRLLLPPVPLAVETEPHFAEDVQEGHQERGQDEIQDGVVFRASLHSDIVGKHAPQVVAAEQISQFFHPLDTPALRRRDDEHVATSDVASPQRKRVASYLHPGSGRKRRGEKDHEEKRHGPQNLHRLIGKIRIQAEQDHSY